MTKQAVVGILAHVDAGKTTLAEAMLFQRGSHSQARPRGRWRFAPWTLTRSSAGAALRYFSSQAVLEHGDTTSCSWMHQVMSIFGRGRSVRCAPSTMRFWLWAPTMECRGTPETLWRLLARYDIPTFIFINKIDLENPGRDVLLAQRAASFRRLPGCQRTVGGRCPWEDTAALDEAALEEFLEVGELSVANAVAHGCRAQALSCFASSALKDQGVDELLDGICALMREQAWLRSLPRASIVSAAEIRGERLALG